MTSAPQALSTLADERAVERVLADFAAALDERDWDSFAALFEPEVEVENPYFFGPGPQRHAARAYADAARTVLGGLDATQHLIANPRVDVAGEEARARASMTARHFLANDRGAPSFDMGGAYDMRLRRGADHAWRIARLALKVRWREGNWHVFEAAARVSAPAGERL